MLKNAQTGIGLVEVMVALLLLAVAVLGFSAMQMRAIQATDETLYRSDAMVAVRNIAEDMRLYPTQAQKAAYRDFVNNPTAPTVNCASAACNETQQMEYNAYQSIQLAKDSQVNISAIDCPGINNSEFQKICLIAAWGNTEPKMDASDTACTDANGIYKKGATCFVMETY